VVVYARESIEESGPVALPVALTSPLPLPDAATDIDWALREFAARAPRYALYHDYLAGDHRLTFVTKGYRRAFQALLAGLRCNLCPRVVHALTDRLRLVGFEHHDTEAGRAGGRPEPPSAADSGQRAWAMWQDARLDRHFNRVKYEAVATGDAYMLVWPDPDEPTRPRFYPQRADQVVCRYDAERPDVPRFAAKLWPEGARYRLNLYHPTHIEKYATPDRAGQGVPEKAAAFLPLADEPTVINPYGRVPIFHFIFEDGKGELKDIIPLQDALNKELGDLVVASEFGAFPMKYAIGVSADEEDEDAIKVGIDRIMTVANKEAKLGEFSSTDLKNYTDTIFAFAELMALTKGIPLHLLRMAGDIPSGESLKTAEAPLVARVMETQIDFGDELEGMMAFGDRIQGGPGDAHLTAVWAPAESRAEKDHVDVIATKYTELEISRAQAWRELEYSEEEIAEMEAEREAAAPQIAPTIPPANQPSVAPEEAQ